ncbi:DUF4232 domain-containing protein [Streptomyces sp. NPDC057557]|uniref:DUF4232 domain-containing protein n=1 Tax=Streptomyces sp. NPDC057557 TaxID=3346167 RepID=UPI0036C99006
MTHRRTLLVALACCAALTGCTSHTPDDGPPEVGSTSPTSSVTGPGAVASGTSDPSSEPTPTRTASGGTGTAAPSPTVPTVRRCHTSDVRASLGPNRPGAGQSSFAIVLTNGSRRTCTLYGFPGVAFVNGAGEAVTPDPERATDQQEQAVTLSPGDSAWSTLTYTNPAITGVTTVTPTALLVTPPDETAPISVRWTGGKVSNTGKASVPWVSPLMPGNAA